MRTNIILASLLALVGYAYTARINEIDELKFVIDFQEKVSQKATKVLIENSDQKVLLHNRQMEDDAKMEYRSLIPIIDKIRLTVDDISNSKTDLLKELDDENLSSKQKHNLLTDFISSSRNLMNENRAVLSYYLSSHNDIYGLREKEIKLYNQNVFDQLRFDNWIGLQNELKGDNNHHSSILIGLHLELTTVVDDVISSLSSLSSGRMIMCNLGIPINIYLIKRGAHSNDLATVLFECPEYAFNRNIPNVDVTVNGEKLEIDYNGIAIYQGQRRKNEILKIEYSYTNPLTGKQYGDQLSYSLDNENVESIID